tara:strand:- start:235 stop:381 length:147 start_codon:yes stop_codon:yes gene_type:complete
MEKSPLAIQNNSKFNIQDSRFELITRSSNSILKTDPACLYQQILDLHN